MSIERISRWRTVMCGVTVLAVATPASTVVAADVTRLVQSGHSLERAIKPSSPPAEPDAVKAGATTNQFAGPRQPTPPQPV